MTSEQWKSVLTTIVPVIGSILVTLGIVSQPVIDTIGGHITEIIGAISVIIGFAYKIWANRTAGVITAAANLPEVTNIKVTTSELAGDATPENVTR